MPNTQFLLVSKDELVLKELHHIISNLGYRNINFCDNEESAIIHANTNEPRLIFCSSTLNYKSILSGLNASFSPGLVLVVDEFEKLEKLPNAITEFHDYINVPLESKAVESSIFLARYRSALDQKNRSNGQEKVLKPKVLDAFYVKHQSRYKKLVANEILYVEALKDYVVINTKNNRYTLHTTMKEVEKKLSKNTFSRIHRSFIINIHKIDQLDYSEISLEGSDKTIPIGGSYRDELNDKLQIL